MMFTYCPNLMFLASLWLEIDFQICHIADFEQFRVDIHFANFGQVKTDPICSFLLLWTGHSYFTVFRQDITQKTIQKIQEPCIGSSRSHFQWFNQRNQELFSQSINTFQRIHLLFLCLTRFSDFGDKIKYSW